MITVTSQAIEKLKEVFEEQGQENSALRVMIMPAANGGVQYMMALEKEPRDDDLVLDEYGVRILVDPDSVPLLEGAEIDYIEGLMRSGFTINNPNLPSGGGCGCGGNCACGGH